MPDDSMYGRDLSMEEAASEVIRAIDFETGMMVMPPEFGDFVESEGDERYDTLDVMIVTLTTADNEEHKFTLNIEDVKELVMHMAKWMNDLHLAGRCDCGDHDTA